mgnify:FL=1|tara:strand:- start:14589 stop:17012 length:2424 start_codon:yes stop_codon:yes gene_type:complete
MKYLISLLLSIFLSFSLIADEGMWLPQLLKSLNEKDMIERGLKLTADDIYDINNSSLKDAIVSLNGGGCTAEMISSNGLMLTNHHCAFGSIQTHSTLENDYLKDGFWAMSNAEELKNDDVTATFLISIEDVSERINSFLNNQMSEDERRAKIAEISKVISKEVSDSTSYSANVKSYFGGNDFYLLIYETFKDVRLVGAPPSSIGKFGGDTDNWMWPRHTGDFSLYRVYMAPDGSPASYDLENIPYKPKHHLPIQLEGVENEDYTMIMGYPGRTNRYLTSFGISEALEISNPTTVDIRTEKLAVIKDGMDANKRVKIQYASKYASTSNYWKYYIGQSKSLKAMKVFDKKKDIENAFKEWVESGDSSVQEKYGNVLEMIESAYNKNKRIALNRTYLNEAVFQGSEILYFSYMMKNRIASLPKDKKERLTSIRKLKKLAKDFYKNYNASVDEKLLSSMLSMYYYNVPKNQHAPVFKKIENQMLGFKKLDFDFYAQNVFKRSVFSSKEKCMEFLQNPTLSRVSRDLAFTTMNSIYDKYMKEIYPTRKSVRAALSKGNRLFMSGLREMDTSKSFYPDANSTMRVTYGSIGDYSPGNAMHYDYFTTIDGIIEKEDETNEEFIVPEKLKELYKMSDYGRYADKNGDLRINFISSNDITGGNSGSPVMNAWGELIGTAFDGNWESMSGDIAFENKIQRTISVDIRYILFIIDKYANASYLIDEMTIAPSHKNDSVVIVTDVITEEIDVISSDKNDEIDKSELNDSLETKNYNGKDIPIISSGSFNNAFMQAVIQLGASSDQFFCWNNNIYTTEKE